MHGAGYARRMISGSCVRTGRDPYPPTCNPVEIGAHLWRCECCGVIWHAGSALATIHAPTYRESYQRGPETPSAGTF